MKRSIKKWLFLVRGLWVPELLAILPTGCEVLLLDIVPKDAEESNDKSSQQIGE